MENKEIDVEVVMLPTQFSHVALVINKLSYSHNGFFTQDNGESPQYIYFTSDEEIKGGDHVILESNRVLLTTGANYHGNSLYTKEREFDAYPLADCKKIVASTDTTLGLPTIPTEWIKTYVIHNGSIKDVKIQTVAGDYDIAAKSNSEGCAGYDKRKLKLTPANEVIIAKYSYPIKEEPKIVKIEGGLPKNNNDGTFSTTPLVAVFSDGTKSDDKNRKLEDAALAYYVKHGNHMGKVDARDGYKAGYKAKEEEAMQDAIGFSEWCGDNYEIFTSTGRWRIRGAENEEEASKIYATEQLYKLWKKK